MGQIHSRMHLQHAPATLSFYRSIIDDMLLTYEGGNVLLFIAYRLRERLYVHADIRKFPDAQYMLYLALGLFYEDERVKFLLRQTPGRGPKYNLFFDVGEQEYHEIMMMPKEFGPGLHRKDFGKYTVGFNFKDSAVKYSEFILMFYLWFLDHSKSEKSVMMETWLRLRIYYDSTFKVPSTMEDFSTKLESIIEQTEGKPEVSAINNRATQLLREIEARGHYLT